MHEVLAAGHNELVDEDWFTTATDLVPDHFLPGWTVLQLTRYGNHQDAVVAFEGGVSYLKLREGHLQVMVGTSEPVGPVLDRLRDLFPEK